MFFRAYFLSEAREVCFGGYCFKNIYICRGIANAVKKKYKKYLETAV